MNNKKAAYSETVFRGRILDVCRDRLELPDGRETTMEVVCSPDATAVVAVNDAGEVLLLDQFRYATGGMLLEIPAGKMEPGENPEECARRELEEETGYRAGSLRHLASFFTTPGFCTEKIHLFLALDLTRGSQNLDRDEFLEVTPVPLVKALEMVDRGEISDAKTIVGLLTAHRVLNK